MRGGGRRVPLSKWCTFSLDIFEISMSKCRWRTTPKRESFPFPPPPSIFALARSYPGGRASKIQDGARLANGTDFPRWNPSNRLQSRPRLDGMIVHRRVLSGNIYIYIYLINQARGPYGRISARGLDSAYKKDQGPIFSPYGPEQAWLIRDLLHDWNCLVEKPKW